MEYEKEEFYQLLDKGFQILCMITFPISAGLFLVADQAVGFFYGKAFSPAGLTIRLMCPLILIKSFGNLFCYQIAYSTKNENIILPASALASVINIIMNAIFIPAFLQNGAAVASVFSELVTNVMQFIYIKKKVRMHLDKRALLIGVVSTEIMSVCVFLIMQIRLPNTIGIFVEMLCGVVVYIWGNLKMKNQLMDEWMKKVMLLASL